MLTVDPQQQKQQTVGVEKKNKKTPQKSAPHSLLSTEFISSRDNENHPPLLTHSPHLRSYKLADLRWPRAEFPQKSANLWGPLFLCESADNDDAAKQSGGKLAFLSGPRGRKSLIQDLQLFKEKKSDLQENFSPNFGTEQKNENRQPF